MKTKHIVLLIGLLIYASSTAAQTRFYDVTRTFHESGFTYQADVSPAGWVDLFNANNRHDIDREQTWRDGRRLTADDTHRFPSTVEPCVLRFLTLLGML